MKATMRHSYSHEVMLSRSSVRPSCVELCAKSLDYNKKYDAAERFGWPFGIIREVTGEQAVHRR